MRVVGWLLTAFGCAVFVVIMGLITMAMMGELSHPVQQLLVSLFIFGVSGLLILTGARLRTRSKPLLPIILTT
ncbi:hypothetical protein IAE39_000588 [Pseudomonas sp. S37]|uniref:hypothetical protein n=1 Tax=Pseudomonas sp. S37 TaxID=2767449 RepID=UPI001913EB30|nr:hypothetical protein [Pseudomonas sp. S37]MBK4992414.1 hypothetical protein [Pseudomonas sp. S37]